MNSSFKNTRFKDEVSAPQPGAERLPESSRLAFALLVLFLMAIPALLVIPPVRELIVFLWFLGVMSWVLFWPFLIAFAALLAVTVSFVAWRDVLRARIPEGEIP